MIDVTESKPIPGAWRDLLRDDVSVFGAPFDRGRVMPCDGAPDSAFRRPPAARAESGREDVARSGEGHAATD